MPVELAGPVAFMSLVPAGKVAMPAFFKAGGVATGGFAGKAATFAGMKGAGAGAGKGLAAGKGGIFKETAKAAADKEKHHVTSTEEVKEEAAALFALLVGGDKVADGLKDERQKGEKGRRVVLSSRGDRSRLYGEFL